MRVVSVASPMSGAFASVCHRMFEQSQQYALRPFRPQKPISGCSGTLSDRELCSLLATLVAVFVCITCAACWWSRVAVREARKEAQLLSRTHEAHLGLLRAQAAARVAAVEHRCGLQLAAERSEASTRLTEAVARAEVAEVALALAQAEASNSIAIDDTGRLSPTSMDAVVETLSSIRGAQLARRSICVSPESAMGFRDAGSPVMATPPRTRKYVSAGDDESCDDAYESYTPFASELATSLVDDASVVEEEGAYDEGARAHGCARELRATRSARSEARSLDAQLDLGGDSLGQTAMERLLMDASDGDASLPHAPASWRALLEHAEPHSEPRAPRRRLSYAELVEERTGVSPLSSLPIESKIDQLVAAAAPVAASSLPTYAVPHTSTAKRLESSPSCTPPKLRRPS